jgi:hypothetical protein
LWPHRPMSDISAGVLMCAVLVAASGPMDAFKQFLRRRLRDVFPVEAPVSELAASLPMDTASDRLTVSHSSVKMSESGN